MKKSNIIIGALICTSLFITSCQQEKAIDPEVMDAKVKEAYEAKIKQIDEEATAACEAKINEKVQSLKDSLSHVSAAQQAALMTKMQRDLEVAKKKAQEVAKKKPSAKPDNSNIKKTSTIDEKGNQVGVGGERVSEKKTVSKVNEQGNQVGVGGERK
jgi:transposase